MEAIDWVKQELVVGYGHLMYCHSFWGQKQVEKFVPLPAGNGLQNWTLSVQAEFLQALSGFQQAPVCLLGSVLTCAPAMTTFTSLLLKI